MIPRQLRKYVTFILGLVIGFGIAIGFQSSKKLETRYVEKEGDHVSLERSINLDLFWDVWELVDEDHIYEEEVADKEDRVEGAIRGMLESLDDPYTLFMDADEAKEFEQSLQGELEGIGVEVTKKGGLITIVTPLKGFPAYKAGILPGDIIAEVDGESTEDMTLHDAVMKIRGKKGTKVLLGIARKGERDLLEIEITRNKVEYDSVKWEKKEGNIAYIEISQFDENTYSNLNSAINEILLEKPEGIIVDLRNNSGGYLDMAVDVLSEFTSEKKKAVIMKSKEVDKKGLSTKDSYNKVIYTKAKARLDGYPLAVLINEGSASASEIVAGAIRDWEVGTLIGMKTFGKGSVQELRLLEGGATLRLTIAKWNTPADVNIDKEGIEPDIEIELTTEDYNNDRDPQLDCALVFLKTGECNVDEVAFWKEEVEE